MIFIQMPQTLKTTRVKGIVATQYTQKLGFTETYDTVLDCHSKKGIAKKVCPHQY
jgi:hypothetical protein